MDGRGFGEAALSGWRRKVADALAPRLPVSDEKVRIALGTLFFALGVRYVVGTVLRARRGEPGS